MPRNFGRRQKAHARRALFIGCQTLQGISQRGHHFAFRPDCYFRSTSAVHRPAGTATVCNNRHTSRQHRFHERQPCAVPQAWQQVGIGFPKFLSITIAGKRAREFHFCRDPQPTGQAFQAVQLGTVARHMVAEINSPFLDSRQGAQCKVEALADFEFTPREQAQDAIAHKGETTLRPRKGADLRIAEKCRGKQGAFFLGAGDTPDQCEGFRRGCKNPGAVPDGFFQAG